MAEGYWHWGHGRTDEALAAFRRAYDLVKDHLVINFHTAEALPMLATALRLHADAIRGEDPGTRIGSATARSEVWRDGRRG